MPITPHGRRCTHVDPQTGTRCITRLCTANEGPDCFAHGRTDPLPREWMEHFAYADLMKQLDGRDRIAA